MTPEIGDLGLPPLSEQELESLAENCEAAITDYIFTKIPAKSIEDLMVSCVLEYTSQLDVELFIDITQKYDTGQDLDALTKEASEHGLAWLDEKLMEMKDR
jgi:hypothetical protein